MRSTLPIFPRSKQAPKVGPNSPPNISLIAIAPEDANKYPVKKFDLMLLVRHTQEREFVEEIEFLEEKGGVKYIVEGLLTDEQNGIKEEEVEDR